MKISSSTNTTITSVTPKVIETSKGVLLNTQYYTKEKLSPIPFETCSIIGSPYSLSIRKQLFLQNYSWNFINDEMGIIKDSNHENRYYMRIIEGYIVGNRHTGLIVFEETENNKINIIKEINLGDAQAIEIADQDDNYLYMFVRSGNKNYINILDKNDYTLTSTYNVASSYHYISFKKIYSDDMYIYFMFIYNQNVYTSSFNKLTHTYTDSSPIYRGQDTTAVNYPLTNLSDTVYKIDENTYGLFLYNAGNQEQPLDLYMYDKSKTITEGFTMQHVNITWNSNKNKIDYIDDGINSYNTIRNFITEFNGVKYLNVFVYKMDYADSTYIPIQGIYTFRIDSATNLTFTGYNQIDGAKHIIGFMYDESKEHLIVAKQNTFQILKFNQNTLKYESTNFEISNCYSVGLDELQRIWYIKTDSSVHMINLEDAQSVEIDFEKQYYEYTGITINTYIEFSALNYLNEEFTGTFELTINGPAVFTENNNETLRFTYNGAGKQQIGITITGASPITIYPKFIS